MISVLIFQFCPKLYNLDFTCCPCLQEHCLFCQAHRHHRTPPKFSRVQKLAGNRVSKRGDINSSSTRGNMTEVDKQETTNDMTQSSISNCICLYGAVWLLLGCGETLYMSGEIKLFFKTPFLFNAN